LAGVVSVKNFKAAASRTGPQRNESLGGRVHHVIVDFDFVMFAAMRAADVKRNEADSIRGGLIRFGALDSGIDLFAGIRTRKYEHAHSRLSEPCNCIANSMRVW
jgi:hypothetical protein